MEDESAADAMLRLINEISNKKRTQAANENDYIGGILSRLEESNRRYYLEKARHEVLQMKAEEELGNLQRVVQHRVLADTYISIAERSFRFC